MNRNTLMLLTALAMGTVTTSICAQTNSKTTKVTTTKTETTPEAVATAVARPLPQPQPTMAVGRYDIIPIMTSNGHCETLRVNMETGDTWILDIDGRNRKAWVSLSRDGFSYRDETTRGSINYMIRISGSETYLFNVNSGNTWALTYKGLSRKPYWEAVR